jgi:hypothetical protein
MLWNDLGRLVEEGKLSDHARRQAVEPVVEYKVRARGVAALKKLGGVLADAVDRAASPKERRVSVRRLNG